MLREEAIKNLKKLKSFHNGSYGTAIDMAIKALEQQPCEDAVSRTLVHEAITASIAESENPYEMWQRIEALPPVTPRTNLARTSQDCISILNRIMEYTYGMLTAEKYGLQHLIKSMMDEMSGGGEDG